MSELAHITYVDACTDAHLFGPWFRGESWATWRVIDKAIFGEPLDADELAIFRELTGRDHAPTEPAREAWLVFGRKAGKDVKAASYCTYLATIGAEVYGYRSRLTHGERGVVQLLAVDRDQAGVCLEYIRAFFEQPMLARMVKRETADSIELTNSLVIEVTTNDRRRVRGRTVICAVLDEVAHWKSDASVNPDEDVYQSIKPSMVTIPNALLIGISSPYARRGLLWRKVNELYGKPGRTLVARAATWRMNPTLSRDHEDIEEAYANDPSWASAEYGAEFRVDVESYVSREAVEACIDRRIFERAPVPGIHYVAFVDPSGGAVDSMTIAIAHKEDEVGVLDCIREVQPQRGRTFSPEAIVAEFAGLLKSYRITTVKGDRYAHTWVTEPFRKHGITYEPADPKDTLYLNFLPLLNSGKVRLLDNKRLVTQLIGLERNTSRSGKDSIGKGRAQHDDVANAVAGCMVAVTARRPQTWVGAIDPHGFVHYLQKNNSQMLEPRTRIKTVRVTEQEALRQKAEGSW